MTLPALHLLQLCSCWLQSAGSSGWTTKHIKDAKCSPSFFSLFFFGNNKYLVGQRTDLFYSSQKKFFFLPLLLFLHLLKYLPPLFFLSYSSTPHLAGFTCWQRLRRQHGNGFTGLGCWLSGETSHNTHIPPTLWSLLMCCGKMYSSFVFMVSTSAHFSFPWIALYIQLPSTCWVLLEGRRYCETQAIKREWNICKSWNGIHECFASAWRAKPGGTNKQKKKQKKAAQFKLPRLV